MAEEKKKVNLNGTSKGILGKNSKKIGSYEESTGGGTPLGKGEKLKDHPEAKRVSQPRDEDGQFTYNSVNGRELKYGPSRGTTVPPFLKGLKLTFVEKGTVLLVDGPDGIKKKIMTIDMSVEEIVNACKYYIEGEEGFAGMGNGSSVDMSNKGRKSEAQKKGEVGIQGKAQESKIGKSTKEAMEKGAAEYAESNSAKSVNPFIHHGEAPFVKPEGFQVTDDKLNEDGTVSDGGGQKFHTTQKDSSGKVSAATAQNNPSKFKEMYPTNINAITKMTGGKATADDVVKEMATGKYGTFAELQEAVKNGSAFGEPAGAGAGAGTGKETVDDSANEESQADKLFNGDKNEPVSEDPEEEAKADKLFNGEKYESDDDKEFDVDLSDNDKVKKFFKTPQFQALWKEAKALGAEKPGAILKGIASGKLNTPAKVKKWIKKKYSKQE